LAARCIASAAIAASAKRNIPHTAKSIPKFCAALQCGIAIFLQLHGYPFMAI
jgi:hypothetical protein